MTNGKPFDQNVTKYETWYEKNEKTYLSELRAIVSLIKEQKSLTLEVGVGTGRFSAPLKIDVGIDPATSALKLAQKRNISVVKGVGELLPFKKSSFSSCMVVTTISFLKNVEKSLKEIFRVLKPKGYIIIGFIDRKSVLGKKYEEKKGKSIFYKKAKFLSTKEILNLLEKVGFKSFKIKQTLFGNSIEELKEIHPIKSGYNEGSFIVIRAEKN